MRVPAGETPLVELRGVTKGYQEGDAERGVLRGVATHSPEVVGLTDRLFRVQEGRLVEAAVPGAG